MQLTFGRSNQKVERKEGYKLIPCVGLGWYSVPVKSESLTMKDADLYEFLVKFTTRAIAQVTKSIRTTFGIEKCKSNVTALFPFITDEIFFDAMTHLNVKGLLMISKNTGGTAHWRLDDTEQRKQLLKDYLVMSKISRGLLKEFRLDSMSPELLEDLKIRRIRGTTIVLESFFVMQLFMSSTYIRDSFIQPNISFSTFCFTHLDGLLCYYLGEPKRIPIIVQLSKKYRAVRDYFQMISYRGEAPNFLSIRDLLEEFQQSAVV